MGDRKYNQGVAVFCRRCNKPFLSWGLPENETLEEHLKTRDALNWIEQGYNVDSFSPSVTLSKDDWCYGSKDSCEPYKVGDENHIKQTLLLSTDIIQKLETIGEKLKLSKNQVIEMLVTQYKE